MKKILFVLIAFATLQISAQTGSKEKVKQLFEVNGKAAYYRDLFAATPTVNTDQFLSEVGDVYLQYLSEADIQTMIDFYQSAEGQKVLHGEVARGVKSAESTAYESFMKTSAMTKFLKHVKEIGAKEKAVQDKWLSKK